MISVNSSQKQQKIASKGVIRRINIFPICKKTSAVKWNQWRFKNRQKVSQPRFKINSVRPRV